MVGQSHIADFFVVTLDCDGVIALNYKVLRKCTQEQYGITIEPHQTERETFPLGKEAFNKIIYEPPCNAALRVMEYELDPDCKPTLTTLFNQGFRFAIVTSRDDEHQINAVKPFVKAHALPISYLHATKHKPKALILRRLRSRAMIDDRLRMLISIQDEVPSELYLFRRPWNAAHDIIPQGTRIKEVGSWSEFANELRFLRLMHEAICYKLQIKNTWSNVPVIANFLHQNQAQAMQFYQSYLQEKAA